MGRTGCTEPQCLYKAALYLYVYLHKELPQHQGNLIFLLIIDRRQIPCNMTIKGYNLVEYKFRIKR